MEVQIKKAIKAGNSSAVILPRAWLNKEVRVELLKKTPEIILSDVLKIAKEHVDLGEITGIYLAGSYARGEEDKNSDIDILIITKDTDKEMIKQGIYNVLLVSAGLLEQKLNQDLLPIGQMLKEAKPLLNSDYLDSIEIKVTKKNVDWYISTTKEKLSLIKGYIDKAKKKKNKRDFSDKVAYTLILRIRTLEIIEKLIKNKEYSKKEFVKLIDRVSKGKNSYERYLAVKNNSKNKNAVSLEEAERLYEYLKNQLDRTEKLLKGLR